MNRRTPVETVVAVLFVASAAWAQEVSLPKEFVSQCEYFLGKWDVETEIDGKVYRGTWDVEWSKDKSCLITYWAGDTPRGRLRSTRIHGWDALT